MNGCVLHLFLRSLINKTAHLVMPKVISFGWSVMVFLYCLAMLYFSEVVLIWNQSYLLFSSRDPQLIIGISIYFRSQHGVVSLSVINLLFSTRTFSHFQPLSVTFSYFQPLSVTFSYFQPLSVTFSHFQLLSVTFSYFQLLSVTFSYFQLLSATFSYFQLLSATFSYFQLLSVTFSYFQLLSVPIYFLSKHHVMS